LLTTLIGPDVEGLIRRGKPYPPEF
jgi:hypothetical protein